MILSFQTDSVDPDQSASKEQQSDHGALYEQSDLGLHYFPLCLQALDTFEPCHEKTCLCHMRTTKMQISLRIRAV